MLCYEHSVFEQDYEELEFKNKQQLNKLFNSYTEQYQKFNVYINFFETKLELITQELEKVQNEYKKKFSYV